MQAEAPPGGSRELPSSALKRSVFLSGGYSRLKVEPDGTVTHLHSAKVDKLVFGRMFTSAFKIQSGIIVPLRQGEWRVKLAPDRLSFSSDSREPVQVSHTTTLTGKESTGYVRTTRYTNNSAMTLLLRTLTIHDPTSLHFRQRDDPPAEIGVNAFNRGDHVVMDDVGDTGGVRVVGFKPRPTKIYLGRNRQSALELMAAGELPGPTEGISGPILLQSQHDFELSPGGSFELKVASVYHESSLEAAISESKSTLSAERKPPGEVHGCVFVCSDARLNSAFAWTRASLGAVERETDLFERTSSSFGTGVLRPELFEAEFLRLKTLQRKDGLLPRAGSDAGAPTETSLWMIHAVEYLELKGDKKLARRWYPTLRKAGKGISKAADHGLIVTKPGSPDGWRRRLPSGYPTGEVAEVNLVAAQALARAAELAEWLDKPAESSGFRHSSAGIEKSVDAKLRDAETGLLALNIDPKGRLHAESTVDQAVALSYGSSRRSLALSMVERLGEKDFETGYGPRTVSKTNPLYYDPTYGEGQLGGCWTRASLAHALLAYASGRDSVGSAALEKIASLLDAGWESMGGVPGEFPYWFDPERKQIHSYGSDPVAASRFVEVLLSGEAGLKCSPEGAEFVTPQASRLSWTILHGFSFMKGGTLFVGRSPSKRLVVSSLAGQKVDGSESLPHGELVSVSPPVHCAAFWNEAALVVCVGNSSTTGCSSDISIPTKGPPLASSLFVDLQEFDKETQLWRKADRRRTLDRLELHMNLGPGEWRVIRATRVTPPLG